LRNIFGYVRICILMDQSNQLPPPEAVANPANWPPPDIEASLPHANTQNDTLSRRGFLKVGATIIAGASAYKAVRLVGGLIQSSENQGNNQSSEAGIEPSVLTPTQEIGPEIDPSPYATKDKYSLQELVSFAQETKFAENDPATLQETVANIAGAKTRQELDSLAKAAVLTMTGRPLYFNHLPGTENTLPDTRADLELAVLGIRMSGFANSLGTLPRTLVGLPSDYNIIEEYLPTTTSDGRGSVDPNIGGTVLHTADSDHLSLDVGTLDHFPTLIHELMHVIQHQQGAQEYIASGAYSRLRAYGAEKFGSVADMLAKLEQIRATEIAAQNHSFATTAELAKSLIFSESSTPDARLEDEAYTTGATITQGLLPEMPDNELITYLRNKQMQALNDISLASGVNFGATLAFRDRFSAETHPKTIASIAKGGVLGIMSNYEAGPLSVSETWENTALPGGTHFVNIGAADKPELITLIAQGTEANPNAPDEPYGMYDLYLSVAVPKEQSLDLRDTPTTTIPQSASPDKIDDNAESVFTDTPPPNPDEIFARTILDRFAPGIGPDNYSVQGFGNTLYPDTGNYVVRLGLNAAELLKHIDTSKLYGRINDQGLFEKF
jgi:hypothetical protein